MHPAVPSAGGRKQYLDRQEKNTSPTAARPEGSLISDIDSDLRRPPKTAYVYVRWLLLAYIVWLLSSRAMATVYLTIIDKFQPVCSTSWLGQKLPWCYAPSSARANITTMSTCQQQLAGMLNSTVEGLSLAMEMSGNEYAISDLNIRVKDSELKRRAEAGGEASAFISLNTEASE
jgi:hypothetical protein